MRSFENQKVRTTFDLCYGSKYVRSLERSFSEERHLIVPKTFIMSVFGSKIIIPENVHRQEYHGN